MHKSESAPSRDQAEAALRTIVRGDGENPGRAALLETPSQAAKALGPYFAGCKQDPLAILNKTFDETCGYEEMVVHG